jgi:hypothetical protein
VLREQDILMSGAVATAAPAPAAPAVETGERAARRALLDQIARLEGELAAAFCASFPREGFDWKVPAARRGPRLLSLDDLERTRDALVERLSENRRLMSERTAREEAARGQIEEMLRDPESFKWQRISNEDIGEPGCKHWHVRPRLGPIGMFMGWWRVKISSGCPLARGRGPRP